ncbi:MAG: DUF1559 domain-containing protein [Planctomycetia bacterium]|nr:DUF1559 domain-containing protein [Planctomycetia bacterium]
MIAIIGMLVGLLLPAVQQAREAARQMQCNNNLRNLALAILNVESSTRSFPNGGFGYSWSGDPENGLGYKQPGSWMYAILPMLEQNALYQLPADGSTADQKADPSNSGMLTLLSTPLSVFHCPSRRSVKTYPTKDRTMNNFALKSSNPCNKTDYAGNCGHCTEGVTGWNFANMCPRHQLPSVSELKEYAQNNRWPDYSSKNTGILFYMSRVTMGQIRDGASNTYLVGEKFAVPAYYEDTSNTSADDYSPFCGGDRDNLRTCYTGTYNASGVFTQADAPFMPMQDRDGVSEDTYSNRFGSCHAGAMGMAMADGSVHRLSYSIDSEVHYAKGCRADGRPASSKPFE